MSMSEERLFRVTPNWPISVEQLDSYSKTKGVEMWQSNSPDSGRFINTDDAPQYRHQAVRVQHDLRNRHRWGRLRRGSAVALS
jgi:hypothetical protein